eukprot:TRINITY_DN5454_c0_g1_i2.p1 TRINITY_DN5454_c0_g1~~TRINITY_DN5454_c0_g1_i2.p1  ORF type:complete len:174 (+),score=8.28 TRINITY_DN5454_c0_g1_i2:43-564(+)
MLTVMRPEGSASSVYSRSWSVCSSRSGCVRAKGVLNGEEVARRRLNTEREKKWNSRCGIPRSGSIERGRQYDRDRRTTAKRQQLAMHAVGWGSQCDTPSRKKPKAPAKHLRSKSPDSKIRKPTPTPPRPGLFTAGTAMHPDIKYIPARGDIIAYKQRGKKKKSRTLQRDAFFY